MGVRHPWYSHQDRDNPCTKDCPDRSVDCHGSCEKYAIFTAKKRAQAEERQRRLRDAPPSYRKPPTRKPY